MPARATKFRSLRKKLKTGELMRVHPGIYVNPEEMEGIEGDFYKATLICGKRSAICLFSALQFYGLSEQLIGKTWVMIPYASPQPKNSSVKAMRSRNPRWKIGIQATPKYRITNIERSIVDAFKYRRIVGVSTAVYALKVALKEKRTDKQKIWDMALKLGTEKILLPYLESI